MAKRYQALITPEVLLWARQRVTMPLEVAARKLGVAPEQLDAWERGAARPTFSQAKAIAGLYRRPLAIFYLPEPPEPLDALHDFRRMPNADRTEPSPELLAEIERAEQLRSVALQLRAPEQTEFALGNSITIDDNPEMVADHARARLAIDIEEQQGWKGDKSLALRRWKDAVERLGVLVLQTPPTPSQSFALEEARGFSIGETMLPVIMINAKDQPGGRIFTLMHEFTHLLLDVTGICDLHETPHPQTEDQRIEVFCNRVAGAVLVPASALLAQPVVRQHPTAAAWTDEEIARLASTFAVSEEALLRRLTLLGLASDAFYRQKREEYRKLYAEIARKGKDKEGFAPYEYMVLRRNGTAYTRMVLEAYYQERITLSKVADYLDIHLKSLAKVERAAFSGLAFD